MGFFNRNDDEEVKKTKAEEETEEEEEESEEDESYEIEIECENCQDSEPYNIPFGITVDEFAKDKKCEVCGCLITTG